MRQVGQESVMSTELLHKYQEEWNGLLNNHSAMDVVGDKPTNPLLLDVPSAYFVADYRVMIFGQETNDWYGEFPQPGGVDEILKTYKEFYTSGRCYSYGGQFWNGVSRLIGALEEQLKPSGKTMAFMWNNVIKIGKANGKGKPSPAILSWEALWFDVVSFEVEKLDPNLVVFFSGPNYDIFINKIFTDAEFQPINARPVRHLARVKSCRLPTDSMRTYHPNYLFRQGREVFYEYLAEIVGAISF
jgi:hypothetical protein